MKIQTIEKLFFTYLLEYSYLFLLLAYSLSKAKKVPNYLLIGIYGVIFFVLLHYYDLIPSSFMKRYQYIYTFLEYGFLTVLIFNFIKNIPVRRFILIISALFIVFQIVHFQITKKQKLDSVVIAVETIIIFLFILLYLRQFFKDNVTNNIYEFPSFWIVVGILIYLGFGFFFNILVNCVPQEQFDTYWHFTFIPEIIKNLLFGMVVLGYPSPAIENKKNKIRVDIPNLDLI